MLVMVQFAVIRLSSSELAVRFVLPITIAGVPAALWMYRDRIGVWVMYVGLAANLAVMLANGGLMPIERSTIDEAVGPTRAATYAEGAWIHGSKDVLTTGGHAAAFGDSIVIPVGGHGIVASPGDIVIWCGVVVLAAEAALRRRRATDSTSATRESGAAPPERRAA
jgi:hypothetical protein